MSPYVCECWRLACAEVIHLTREQFERVRSDSRWFAVRPGHVSEDVERVVERSPTYWVVEKFGEAGEIADITDARGNDERPSPSEDES